MPSPPSRFTLAVTSGALAFAALASAQTLELRPPPKPDKPATALPNEGW
jgi:hypothetical protein